VRKGLGDGHITPQPLTVMMELQNALLCISRQTGVKEVFDGSRFCDVTVVGHSDTFLSRGNRLQKDYSSKTVRPAKAGMISGCKSHRGKSPSPVA